MNCYRQLSNHPHQTGQKQQKVASLPSTDGTLTSLFKQCELNNHQAQKSLNCKAITSNLDQIENKANHITKSINDLMQTQSLKPNQNINSNKNYTQPNDQQQLQFQNQTQNADLIKDEYLCVSQIQSLLKDLKQKINNNSKLSTLMQKSKSNPRINKQFDLNHYNFAVEINPNQNYAVGTHNKKSSNINMDNDNNCQQSSCDSNSINDIKQSCLITQQLRNKQNTYQKQDETLKTKTKIESLVIEKKITPQYYSIVDQNDTQLRACSEYNKYSSYNKQSMLSLNKEDQASEPSFKIQEYLALIHNSKKNIKQYIDQLVIQSENKIQKVVSQNNLMISQSSSQLDDICLDIPEANSQQITNSIFEEGTNIGQLMQTETNDNSSNIHIVHQYQQSNKQMLQVESIQVKNKMENKSKPRQNDKLVERKDFSQLNKNRIKNMEQKQQQNKKIDQYSEFKRQISKNLSQLKDKMNSTSVGSNTFAKKKTYGKLSNENIRI